MTWKLLQVNEKPSVVVRYMCVPLCCDSQMDIMPKYSAGVFGGLL